MCCKLLSPCGSDRYSRASVNLGPEVLNTQRATDAQVFLPGIHAGRTLPLAGLLHCNAHQATPLAGLLHTVHIGLVLMLVL